MKLKIFFLFSLAVVSLAVVDYRDLTTGAWTAASCQEALSGRYLSPINVTGSQCSAYDSFSLNLPGTIPLSAVDATYGGPYYSTFTTGTMTVNSIAYKTTGVVIRRRSEHIIHGTRGDLEMQVFMTRSDSASEAVLSFIIRSAINEGLLIVEGKHSIFTTTSTQITVDFSAITNMVKTKLENGLFLNLFTYEGVSTVPPCGEQTWFIYGSELYIKPADLLNIEGILTTAETNGQIFLNTDDENSRAPTGNFEVTRLCFTGYFETAMNENYGLWFGVTIIVLWFIVNLILGEKPIKDENYKENTWTHHPFVSIKTHGNDIFTRKQRMALLLVTITVHALFSSAWWRRSDHKDRASNIIVFAIYSMLVNWGITYMIGLMLRGYTLAKHQYYKTKNEAWDEKAQNRIFAFYFSLFIVIVIGWPFTVWNMGELHAEIDPKPSDYWVATFFVGLGLELLIIDPIVCLLAKKIGFVHKFIKGKGYFYDNLTHETYLTYQKWE